jgi:hypothetical protein
MLFALAFVACADNARMSVSTGGDNRIMKETRDFPFASS